MEQNYKRIIKKFKNYNSANEIIFIVNSEYSSEIIPVYQVAKDAGDGVARSPIEKNKELKEIMSSCIIFRGGGERENNLIFYKQKENREKLQHTVEDYGRKEYIHNRQYG